MRTARFLLLLICSLALVGSAAATRISILDPPLPAQAVQSSPFQVSFGDCSLLLPNSNPAQMGCFGFANRTSADWVGLELVLAAPSNAFSFSCDDDPAGPLAFGNTSCGYNVAKQEFELNFYNGVIPNNTRQYFVITEDDLPPGALTFTAYATYASATPEPPGLMLLGTGLLCGAVLLWSRRRVSA